MRHRISAGLMKAVRTATYCCSSNRFSCLPGMRSTLSSSVFSFPFSSTVIRGSRRYKISTPFPFPAPVGKNKKLSSPVSRRPAAPQSFPRTKLPFLQQVVQRVLKMPPIPMPISPQSPSLTTSSFSTRNKNKSETSFVSQSSSSENGSPLYMVASSFAPYPPDLLSEGKGGSKKAQDLQKKNMAPKLNGGCANGEEKSSPKGTSTKNTSFVLYRDEACVLVNDAYPKSTVHALILPLDPSLQSLNDLNGSLCTSSSSSFPRGRGEGRGTREEETSSIAPFSSTSESPSSSSSSSCTTSEQSQWTVRPQNHIQLLEHMCRVADSYVQFLQKVEPTKYANRRFITGFHSLPSLPQLHMHLISMDLESPCLKHKKHYNSFSTYFFLTSDRIVDDLKKNQYITLNQDTSTLAQYEKQAMECLWCGMPLKDMPSMKRHVPHCSLNKAYITSP